MLPMATKRAHTRLNPQQTVWLVRRHMEGITHEQIGRELNISARSVTQRVYRLRRLGVNIPRGRGLSTEQRQVMRSHTAEMRKDLERLAR